MTTDIVSIIVNTIIIVIITFIAIVIIFGVISRATHHLIIGHQRQDRLILVHTTHLLTHLRIRVSLKQTHIILYKHDTFNT